jgi:hypothetical protein
MRLIINGNQIELDPSVTIARTLQANDIGSPETREANYTNTFNIPRTSNNVKTFKMLGIIGNNSNIPYQKNEAYLYDDTGFCLVYKGWAVINETSNTFKCNIFDGIIDFYKAIENKTLADLNLTALAHEKTPAEVISTQDLSKPYVYVLADYNGKVKTGSHINSDYLVPSVKVPWLWEKIEAFTGYQLNGSFKTNPDFTNLLLTYPKAVPPLIGATLVSSSTIEPDRTLIVAGDVPEMYVNFNNTGTTIDTTALTLELDDNNNQTILKAVRNIQLRVTFVLNPNFAYDRDGEAIDTYATFNGSTFLCRPPSKTVTNFYTLSAGQELDFRLLLFNNQGFFYPDITVTDFFTSCQINELTNAVLFEEEFAGMSIKQFVSEILWRFNLTMFKDPFFPSYTLKQLNEIVNGFALPYSDKFVSLESESYIVGDYGQRSWLRHRYDDENSFYNDGYFDVNNTNLPEAKTIIKSATYSPEFNSSNALGFSTNVYKFWNKEVKDSGEVGYKPVSNRFYFLKSQPIVLSGTTIKSEVLGDNTHITNARRESFTNLKFSEIADYYYSEMQQLLNQSKMMNVLLRLTEIDIVSINLSMPVHIEQLGGSFLINKIENFIPNQLTKVELIKLNK